MLYRFGTKTAQHHFCSICGINRYHPRSSSPAQYGVNVARLAGTSPFDFIEVPINDGVNHPLDNILESRVASTLRYDRWDTSGA